MGNNGIGHALQRTMGSGRVSLSRSSSPTRPRESCAAFCTPKSTMLILQYLIAIRSSESIFGSPQATRNLSNASHHQAPNYCSHADHCVT